MGTPARELVSRPDSPRPDLGRPCNLLGSATANGMRTYKYCQPSLYMYLCSYIHDIEADSDHPCTVVIVRPHTSFTGVHISVMAVKHMIHLTHASSAQGQLDVVDHVAVISTCDTRVGGQTLSQSGRAFRSWHEFAVLIILLLRLHRTPTYVVA